METSGNKKNYAIRDIITYREIDWDGSEDFFYLREIPSRFEPDPVTPGYYCMGMINSGGLLININNTSYDLTKNSLMVYRPNEPFRVISIDKGTTGAFVLFTKKFLDFLNENIFSVRHRSFLSYGMGNLIELSNIDRDKLSLLFREIFSLLEIFSTASWELIARNLTSALLLETDNIMHKYIAHALTNSIEDSNTVSEMINLINQHFRERKSVQFYANTLGISQRSLTRKLISYLNTTPSALINLRLLSEARHLVANTNSTIGEIAYSIGFNDAFAFSKFFKKNTGLSPKSFRTRFK
jgi:AraC family transcriptional activator of pobA